MLTWMSGGATERGVRGFQKWILHSTIMLRYQHDVAFDLRSNNVCAHESRVQREIRDGSRHFSEEYVDFREGVFGTGTLTLNMAT